MSHFSSAPKFDPAALLARPSKATSTKDRKEPANAYKSVNPADNEEDEVKGIGSFIERHHNVQDRDRPMKRVKAQHKDEDSDSSATKRSKVEGKDIHSTGELGGYLKNERKKLNSAPNGDVPMVDLTAADHSDNESQVIFTKEMRKDNPEQEVCLGRIDGARANCFKVPHQKSTVATTQAHWMPITVTLYRRPGPGSLIGVVDPSGVDFGAIDARVAPPLCQLLDGQRLSKLRLTARLDGRKKEPFEYPGQPISRSHAITINIYALRKYGYGIGKLLSTHGIWLRDPFVVDRGIPLANPHAPKDHTPQKRYDSDGKLRPSLTQNQRTVEEVRQDVFKVFDTIADNKVLPQMNAPNPIVTPLLDHQKQAVYFLNKQERLPVYVSTGDSLVIDDDDEEDSKSSSEKSKLGETEAIWQKKTRPNGRVVWRNAITGHENKEQPRPLLGGILADVMGLGKTLNILSLLVGSLTQAKEFGRREVSDDEESEQTMYSRATLLICPLSTIVNWEEQIRTHLKKNAIKYIIYQGPSRTNDTETLANYDLVITTYQTVASEYARNPEVSKNRPNKPIFEINWFRVVLDEAHQIRNTSSLQSKAANDISAERRWCVTGTPVQNKLEDLGALIKFLKISPFDELGNFGKFISSPLRTGDAEAIPKLRILVDSITLRRLKDKLDLPKREEHIVPLKMSVAERNLYDQFARDSRMRVEVMVGDKQKLGGKSYAQALKAIGRLRMLCAHKEDMLSDSDWDMAKGFDAANAIDLEDENDARPEKSTAETFEMYRLMKQANVATCSHCNDPIEPAADASHLNDGENGEPAEDEVIGYMTPCNQMFCCKAHVDEWKKQLNKVAGADNRANCYICDAYVRVVADKMTLRDWLMNEETQGIIQKSKFARNLSRYSEPHTKTKKLLQHLNEQQDWSDEHPNERPIKSVVFSEWTTHLDLIQLAFTNNEIPYVRLDGSMRFSQRTDALTTFEISREVNVILVSLKAGGLGLNLTAASRVFVMEPNYNPAAEQQAIERVHRLGQERDVIIRRFIMENSIEEKILDLQKKKIELGEFSIDRDKTTMMEGKDKAQKMKQKLDDLRNLLR